MIKATVIQKGKGIFLDIVNLSAQLSDKHTKKLANETVNIMRDNIRGNIHRPESTEKLSLSINFEKTENGYGVGNINYLKQNVPYWAALNWGSQHLLGKHMPLGTFSPGIPRPSKNDFRNGRWQKRKQTSDGKLYSPIVTKAIQATNYIEKTITTITSRIQDLLK